MPAPLPSFVDHLVTCEKCGRQFTTFMRRVVTVGEENTSTLVDRDGDVVFDLVKACKSCNTLFHWHSKEATMKRAAESYQLAFDLLKNLYSGGEESAIIKSK